MKKIKYSVALLSLAAICRVAHADSAAALHQLLEQHWKVAKEEQFFFRTDSDTYRPDGPLIEVDDAARLRRHQFNESMLKKLDALDPSSLRDQDRISYQLFRYEREMERDSYHSKDHLFPFTSLFGYHTYFAAAPANMTFNNSEDYEKFLVSLAHFPRYNAQQLAQLQQAVTEGYTHYCGAMQGYEDGIAALIVDSPQDSPLYAPFASMPASIAATEALRMQQRAQALLAHDVMPAYQELYRFFMEVYLPACREQPGIGSLKDGDNYYRYLLRYFTTTDMSPREIHDLGLQETRRIRREMQEVIKQTGFEGSFQDFLAYLRNEPRFYAEDAQDLLEKTAFIAKRMDGMMPKYFGKLAQNTYEIRGTSGRGAYYVAGPPDGSSAGVYFINVKNLRYQPLYNLEALTLHEAVPGHHHQTALAMELDLPEFRRTVYHAAFSEGWGLYAESLGKEAGFYQDPYSNFGRLTYEMWRANRLVVDTGLHAFGWSRQQAIDYLLEHTALTEPEVVAEVDRYITWPGQATAYKVGELRIKALRRRAESALGDRFDLRAFHDKVVGNGSVAIAILERIIENWIQSETHIKDQ